MKESEILKEFQEIKDMHKKDEITLIEIDEQKQYVDFTLPEQKPVNFINLGKKLGARIFYYHIRKLKPNESLFVSIKSRREEIEIRNDSDEDRITFFELYFDYQNRIHRLTIQSNWLTEKEEKSFKELKDKMNNLKKIEDELAEKLSDDRRFNWNCGVPESEVILKSINNDILDQEEVRIDIIHRKAKALLKIKRG